MSTLHFFRLSWDTFCFSLVRVWGCCLLEEKHCFGGNWLWNKCIFMLKLKGVYILCCISCNATVSLIFNCAVCSGCDVGMWWSSDNLSPCSFVSAWILDERQRASQEQRGCLRAQHTLPLTLSQERLITSGQEQRAKKHGGKRRDNIDQGEK